ncbi:hypothetical protein M408DRAFT_334374 [Serendipita vermifera MAFF 305830]|uniref:Uncharacterized protein n=1 Tax=Serendipita vermifera MAFF 305830 TaxID=933852 RepID=A0A0C2VYW8_SERVB|nr:hypothetical protein M408DRAFT_334374 [Serendipita vermifera MAFF 305830]
MSTSLPPSSFPSSTNNHQASRGLPLLPIDSEQLPLSESDVNMYKVPGQIVYFVPHNRSPVGSAPAILSPQPFPESTYYPGQPRTSFEDMNGSRDQLFAIPRPGYTDPEEEDDRLRSYYASNGDKRRPRRNSRGLLGTVVESHPYTGPMDKRRFVRPPPSPAFSRMSTGYPESSTGYPESSAGSSSATAVPSRYRRQTTPPSFDDQLEQLEEEWIAEDTFRRALEAHEAREFLAARKALVARYQSENDLLRPSLASFAPPQRAPHHHEGHASSHTSNYHPYISTPPLPRGTSHGNRLPQAPSMKIPATSSKASPSSPATTPGVNVILGNENNSPSNPSAHIRTTSSGATSGGTGNARHRILPPAAAQDAANLAVASFASATATNKYHNHSATSVSRDSIVHTTLPTHNTGDFNPLKRSRSPSLGSAAETRHEKRVKDKDGSIPSTSNQPSNSPKLTKQHSKPLAKRRRAKPKDRSNANDTQRLDFAQKEVEEEGSGSGSGELSYAESRSSTSSFAGYGSDSNSDASHSARAAYMAQSSSQSSLDRIFASIERSINSRQSHSRSSSLSSR